MVAVCGSGGLVFWVVLHGFVCCFLIWFRVVVSYFDCCGSGGFTVSLVWVYLVIWLLSFGWRVVLVWVHVGLCFGILVTVAF